MHLQGIGKGVSEKIKTPLAPAAQVVADLRTLRRHVSGPRELVRNQLMAHGLSAARIKVVAHFQALPSDEQLHTDDG
jgi:hypothetical protein